MLCFTISFGSCLFVSFYLLFHVSDSWLLNINWFVFTIVFAIFILYHLGAYCQFNVIYVQHNRNETNKYNRNVSIAIFLWISALSGCVVENGFVYMYKELHGQGGNIKYFKYAHNMNEWKLKLLHLFTFLLLFFLSIQKNGIEKLNSKGKKRTKN